MTRSAIPPIERSAKVRAAVDRIRLAGERAAAATASGMAMGSVEPAPPGTAGGDAARPSFRVTLGVLDEALRPSLQVVDVRGGRELAGLMRMVAPGNRARMRTAARLATAGAVALVDAVTVAALDHCGTTAEEVTARLAGGEKIVRLPFGGARQLKAWLTEGRLRCSFEPDDRVRWTGTRLVLRQRLPASYGIALTGRPLATVIDHPALPGTLRVARVEPAGDEVEITLRQRTRPVRLPADR